MNNEPHASAELVERKTDSDLTVNEGNSGAGEQRREVWLKLLEADACLGSWNKETGEWIPLIR